MKITFSKTKQKTIKKVFGRGYARKIQKYLNKRKIFNVKNKPFSYDSIRNIFTGQTTNNEVLEAIEDLYQEELKRLEVLKEKIKK